MSLAGIDACLAGYGLARVRPLKGLAGVHVVKVTGPADDAVLKAAALYQDARTVYSHPDSLALRKPQQTDTYYASHQWHLNNTGQFGATPDADVDWPEAWSEALGSPGLKNVIITVFDDSVQKDHPDLKANWYRGFDFWDMDTDPSPGYSFERHGTCVAGVALATMNNGVGVVGAAPTARLIGIMWGYYASDDADAFMYAKNNGAYVINNSWSYFYTQPPDVVRDAITHVSKFGRGEKGTIVIFSAGNEYTSISRANPVATLPEVIAVGASNSDDVRSAYSNTGPELCVVAPSSGSTTGTVSITTTDVTGDPNTGIIGYNDGSGTDIYGYPDLADANYTMNFGGTSSAAPLVSGVIGLMLGVNPNLTLEQVRRTLEHTADQIDLGAGAYGPLSGHSDFYGYGRVNAYEAVAAAKQAGAGLTWPPPVSNLRQRGTSTVNLSWWNPTDEVASVMVLHTTLGAITWTPQGMRAGETPQDYAQGTFVAAGLQVVQNDPNEVRNTYTADPGPGTHYYAVFVRNSADRWSWGRSVDVPLGGKGAPKASVVASPRVGSAPLAVDFRAGAVDPDTEDVTFTYAWDFGDGTTLPTGNHQGTSHSYAAPGTYMAKLTVTDGTGLTGTAMVMIQITDQPNQSPTAQILLTPGDGQAPHTVQLRGVASDPDGTIRQYLWDFGDNGTAAAGQVVEHTYTQPGAYAITLEVVDNQGGSATATWPLSVWNSTGGTSKPSNGQAPQLCGTCGSLGMPALMAAMLGWGLLHLRRRR